MDEPFCQHTQSELIEAQSKEVFELKRCLNCYTKIASPKQISLIVKLPLDYIWLNKAFFVVQINLVRLPQFHRITFPSNIQQIFSRPMPFCAEGAKRHY